MLDSDSGDSDGWDEDIYIGPGFKCLLCEDNLNCETAFLQHLSTHGDWGQMIVSKNGEIQTQYDWIRFINYVRQKVSFKWKVCIVFVCYEFQNKTLLL